MTPETLATAVALPARAGSDATSIVLYAGDTQESYVNWDTLKNKPKSCRGKMAKAAMAFLIMTVTVPESTAFIHELYPGSLVSGRWILLYPEVGLKPNSTVTVDFYNTMPARDTCLLLVTSSQLEARGSKDSYGQEHFPEHGDSYIPSAWRSNFYKRVNASFQVRVAHTDRYYLVIGNTYEQTLSLSGSVKFVGPGDEQLTAEYTHVPTVELVIGIFFWASSLFYLLISRMSLCQAITPVHIIVLTMFLRGLVALLEWKYYSNITADGKGKLLDRLLIQLVMVVQDVLELMMLLSISFGWRVLRENLSPAEIRCGIGVATITFFFHIFEVVCTTQASCSNYQLGRYIIESLCYLVVIVAMNVNLQIILQQLRASPVSTELGHLYIKFRAYCVFRWVVLAFVLLPTVDLCLKTTVLPWDAIWMYQLVGSLMHWILYAVIALCFRPRPKPLGVFELTHGALSDDDEAIGDE
eukprot:TRINITY_DN51352_c0_g1_i1.p1 TRINITY_DN51352_c0_g1~~TRINITY_DN51352_c0_g1_i1.p1  ORF type:complete len:469 (-),score=39.06 TRINITY_DN51352_c0_g1_i1:156-1562(-)